MGPQIGLGQIQHIQAVYKNSAPGRIVEPAQEGQERGFAAAYGAHQGGGPARRNM